MGREKLKHQAQTNSTPEHIQATSYTIGCSEYRLKRQKNTHANSYCPGIGQGHNIKIEVSMITDATEQITAGQCKERQTQALLKRKMCPF